MFSKIKRYFEGIAFDSRTLHIYPEENRTENGY